MAHYALPSLRDVSEAAQLISHKIVRTPVIASREISRAATSNARASHGNTAQGATIEVFFKCENFQRTGSFKFRGASHFLSRLPNDSLKNGIVTYSTGNHAQAVAHAAQLASQDRQFRIPTFVVVPSNCPGKKIKSARQYGATVTLSGTAPQDRVEVASKIRDSTGAILVPPADHLDIALGQATLVREFLQQMEQLGHGLPDAIIVPSGGGGLLVGATAMCKPLGVTVFGAEPECGGPGLAKARRRGTRMTSTGRNDEQPTIADGLRSLTGEANWEIVKRRENVEEVFTVTEEDIKSALRVAVENLGFAIEPSAAVPLAAALFNRGFQRWSRDAKASGPLKIGVVLTGGNINAEELRAILPGVSLSGGN